jgi:hypothetical protein
MQKILLIICAILTTTSANATQMCARRDTTVIPLDGAAPALGANGSGLENMWWVRSGYGQIYGISTCLSLPEIKEYVPAYNGSNVLPVISDSDDIQGRSGVYFTEDGTEYDREYCYCKLTHPMTSNWISWITLKGGSCAGICYDYCYSGIAQQAAKRTAMFNTIGYGYESIDTNEYDESIDLN